MYKRQGLDGVKSAPTAHGGFRLKRRRCAGQAVRVLIVKCENDRVSDGRVRYARNGDVPVSYTHLDVYKRQDHVPGQQ